MQVSVIIAMPTPRIVHSDWEDAVSNEALSYAGLDNLPRRANTDFSLQMESPGEFIYELGVTQLSIRESEDTGSL